MGTGGYFRWFTDISAQGCYPHTIIFPKDDLMTLVFNGAEGGREELDGKTDGAAGIAANNVAGISGCRLYECLRPGFGRGSDQGTKVPEGGHRRSQPNEL